MALLIPGVGLWTLVWPSHPFRRGRRMETNLLIVFVFLAAFGVIVFLVC
jgi:hypothetical protein